MSYYVDAADQRAKARRAEQVFLEHAERRTPRPPQVPDDGTEQSALPPVFYKDGHFEASRETSLDKRAARFRDTHLYGPPPPPPTSPDAIPRVLPPRRYLVPQHVADQGITNDPRFAVRDQPHPQDPPSPGWSSALPGMAPEPPRLAPAPLQLLPPDVQRFLHGHAEEHGSPPAQPLLTPSQKKRLRRKRAKEQRGAQPARPAPYPLPQDALAPPSTNGHAAHPAPPPEPLLPALRVECGAEVLVTLSQRGTPTVFRFTCPLKPWPHPNQPHMIRLSSHESQPGTEIFVGWWNPGE